MELDTAVGRMVAFGVRLGEFLGFHTEVRGRPVQGVV